MYFSRIRLQRGKISTAELSRVLLEDGYGSHQAIWRFFQTPGKLDRDFLFRQEVERSSTVFLTVSSSRPRDESGAWLVETKPYHPLVRTGDRLAFALRANPIVTRWIEEGAKKRHARHDVVMEEKYRLKKEKVHKSEWPTTVELAHKHGFLWLDKRAESCGFSLKKDMVRVDGYRQHVLRKASNNRRIHLSTLDFSGVLTVTQPDRFREALFSGIGPAKSFGCGLLLLRRL